MPPKNAGNPDATNELDARSLRGLAHPLRIQLLTVLRAHGPATASRLGERLGESSGSTSYHLRQLAAYGFVVEDPELGTARERWWKAAHRGTHWDAAGMLRHPDAEVRGAMGLLMHEMAAIHTRELSTWLGTLQEWTSEWHKSSDVSDFSLHLDPASAKELLDRLHTLIESYRDRPAAAPGAESYRVHLHAFPRADD
ncbi:helix-turn-helix domain-containing protein [Streptomyces sp. NPDC002055]|uniref:helix-turn-helix domain-containing protein n=1 Tax=Streptomyces sp. NPDC002055 TaxID=3154534 RepID=UPI00332FA2A8